MDLKFAYQFDRKAHISIRSSRAGSYPILTIRNGSLEIEITHWSDHPQLKGRTTGYATVYTDIGLPDHHLAMAGLKEANAFAMAEELLMPLTGGYGQDVKFAPIHFPLHPPALASRARSFS